MKSINSSSDRKKLHCLTLCFYKRQNLMVFINRSAQNNTTGSTVHFICRAQLKYFIQPHVHFCFRNRPPKVRQAGADYCPTTYQTSYQVKKIGYFGFILFRRNGPRNNSVIFYEHLSSSLLFQSRSTQEITAPASHTGVISVLHGL